MRINRQVTICLFLLMNIGVAQAQFTFNDLLTGFNNVYKKMVNSISNLNFKHLTFKSLKSILYLLQHKSASLLLKS